MTGSPSRHSPGSASAPTAISQCDRYLCSVYSLVRRPESHRVICLLLAKTRAGDDKLRAFISQHIDTADVPDWLQAHGSDDMVTMNFALPRASSYVPFLLTQLFDCCGRSSATRGAAHRWHWRCCWVSVFGTMAMGADTRCG